MWTDRLVHSDIVETSENSSELILEFLSYRIVDHSGSQLNSALTGFLIGASSSYVSPPPSVGQTPVCLYVRLFVIVIKKHFKLI